MKKQTIIFRTLATLLMAGATFASCTKDEDQMVPVKQTYTMTVQATKVADNGTKDLSLSGNTLSALWAENEQVTVRNITKNADLDGYLEAQTAGESTTLKGSLTGTIENGDKLLLKFSSPNYTSQQGTIEYIAANCDYAEAEVTVTDASTSSVTTSDASFTNKQAIVKFTLKNYEGDGISASRLTIEVGGNEYTINPPSYRSELYVALPGFSGQTVTLTANTTGNDYEYIKTGVSFSNSQYYTISVNMKKIVDLSSLKSDYEAGDGDILTKVINKSSVHQISIADDATITLRDATINGKTAVGSYVYGKGIICTGDATIILEGDNIVEGDGYSGIEIKEGYTLTIRGNGSLTATSHMGSGIGGGSYGDWNGGSIVIQSGTINATGGDNSAGIGGSPWIAIGSITISGGTINATGGTGAAGIGCGYGDNADPSSCTGITITGGTINATGGNAAAAIGCGQGDDYDGEEPYGSTCGAITISGASGSLTAGAGATVTVGANGALENCTSVTVNSTSYPSGYTGTSL